MQNKSNNKKSYLKETLRFSILGIIVKLAYEPKIVLPPITLSDIKAIVLQACFMGFIGFLIAYVQNKSIKNKASKNEPNMSSEQPTIQDKTQAAKDIYKISSVTLTLKTWVFIIGFTYIHYWYFTHDKKIMSP